VGTTVEPAAAVIAEFEAFVAVHGERLRRVLVAQLGVHVGNDVCSDALAYAWEHWDRLASMENPTGYLYRVARSAARRHRRWRDRPGLPTQPAHDETSAVTTDLGAALARLRPHQRTCVVMVHVYGWTYRETADALGMTPDSVRNHLHRGMQRLRELLED
jgi:RNA polymerase sigma factor (sigma-70 family)